MRPAAKVRPVFMSDKRITEPLQLTDDWHETYGSGRCHSRDFWYARRAFLSSYHFSEQNGFKDKLKRSVKELNVVATGIVGDIRRRIMSKRRLGIRVYRLTVALPSLVLVTIRCFTPWLNERVSTP